MTAFRYWRLKITSWGGSGTSGAPRAQNLRFLDGNGVAYPPDMTSATTPSPYAVTASTYYSDSTSFLYPWKAFDTNTTDNASRWHGGLDMGTAWLQIDMGTALTFTQIQYTPDVSGVFSNDFQILGSNTGSFAGEETVVADFAGITTGWTALVSRTFFLAPSTGQLPLVLPMLTAAIFSGPVFSGQLPALSASIFSAAQSALTLPMLVGSARGGSNASATLPMLSAEIAGSPGVLQGVTAALPMLTASARSGGNASAVLPALQGFATATFYGWAQTAATLPALRASASGTTGGIAAASATLPMFVASSQGGANAAATLPMLVASAGATVGGVASVAATLPRLVAGLAGSRGNTVSMSATLPALRVVNSGVLRATLPALVGMASGYTVVAYTYEAYSINLKKTRKDQPTEVTRYTNYPFTQILRYRNAYYGVAADGLYLLGGDTDAGAAIASDWCTHMTDFGSIKLKTPEALYVGGRIGPTATATAVVGEKGDQVYSYATPRTGAQNYRIKLGKGLKSRYYGFGLADPAGGAMDIDTLDIPIDGMSRGI